LLIFTFCGVKTCWNCIYLCKDFYHLVPEVITKVCGHLDFERLVTFRTIHFLAKLGSDYTIFYFCQLVSMTDKVLKSTTVNEIGRENVQFWKLHVKMHLCFEYMVLKDNLLKDQPIIQFNLNTADLVVLLDFVFIIFF